MSTTTKPGCLLLSMYLTKSNEKEVSFCDVVGHTTSFMSPSWLMHSVVIAFQSTVVCEVWRYALTIMLLLVSFLNRMLLYMPMTSPFKTLTIGKPDQWILIETMNTFWKPLAWHCLHHYCYTHMCWMTCMSTHRSYSERILIDAFMLE